MKKWLLAVVIILIIVFGFLVGRYLYKLSITEDNFNSQIAESEKIEDECTLKYENSEKIKEANAKAKKVSPNAKLITNIYYEECGHTVKRTNTIENKYINLTEEELAEEYDDWEIKKFTPEEIIIQKEEKGICNEHYIVKEKDGYIAVYSLDNEEEETIDFITEISVQFLPLTDSEKLKTGIRVYGKDNLNSLLEDFE